MAKIIILAFTIITLFSCGDSTDKILSSQNPNDKVTLLEETHGYSGMTIKLNYKFIYDSEQKNKFIKEIEIKTNDSITQLIKPKNKTCAKGFNTWIFNNITGSNNKVFCLEYEDSAKTFPYETWVYNSEKRLFSLKEMAKTHILKNRSNHKSDLIIKERLKMLFGRDSSTSISIVELSVDTKSKHLQTIELNNRNGILEFKDWNFDGYKDISLFLDHGGSSCNGDGVFEIWLFNPLKNEFEYSKLLANECIYYDLKSKRVSFSTKEGASSSTSKEMKWVGNKLIVDKTILITTELRDDSDGKGHLLKKTITTQYIGNQKKTPLIETEFTD